MSGFSISEWEWIGRRAEKIAMETGEPLPMARSTAMAQLLWLRSLPKADVVELETHRPRLAAKRESR